MPSLPRCVLYDNFNKRNVVVRYSHPAAAAAQRTALIITG